MNQQMFMLDFEIGVISAIKSLFAASIIKCCNFHFSQCIWRKVQSVGLKKDYGNNLDVTKTIKRLISLPLIKAEHIDDVFEKIITDAGENSSIDKLLEYFYENFYKVSARFVRDWWISSDIDGPRTTNHIEGWHNALNLGIKISHPNIWIFINKIMEQQKIFETRLLIQDSGADVVKKRKKWIVLNKKREKLKEMYQNNEITPIQFLDRIKY